MEHLTPFGARQWASLGQGQCLQMMGSIEVHCREKSLFTRLLASAAPIPTFFQTRRAFKIASAVCAYCPANQMAVANTLI